MPSDSKSNVNTATPTDDVRKAKRRSKLRAMVGKRPNTSGGITAPKTTGAVPQMQGDSGVDVMARRKAVIRIFKILSDTPADKAGMVEGTPFTQAGVAHLLDTLKSRTSNESQNGAKVAAGILKFLNAKDGEANVHGASLERLQRLAKTAEGQMKKRGRRSAN